MSGFTEDTDCVAAGDWGGKEFGAEVGSKGGFAAARSTVDVQDVGGAGTEEGVDGFVAKEPETGGGGAGGAEFGVVGGEGSGAEPVDGEEAGAEKEKFRVNQ